MIAINKLGYKPLVLAYKKKAIAPLRVNIKNLPTVSPKASNKGVVPLFACSSKSNLSYKV